MSWIVQLDQSLFFFINTTLTNSAFDLFFPFITDLHKNQYFISIVYSLILFLLIRKFAKKGLLIFLFCILTVGTIDAVGNHGFKKNFQRLRPGDNPTVQTIVRSPYGGYSFVSNHAANMFGFAFFMSYFLVGLRLLFLTIAALIAFSRVYNGVHFPADVLAGAVLGITIAYGYIKLYQRIFESEKRKSV